jgi:hypothetical protein
MEKTHGASSNFFTQMIGGGGGQKSAPNRLKSMKNGYTGGGNQMPPRGANPMTAVS